MWSAPMTHQHLAGGVKLAAPPHRMRSSCFSLEHFTPKHGSGQARRMRRFAIGGGQIVAPSISL